MYDHISHVDPLNQRGLLRWGAGLDSDRTEGDHPHTDRHHRYHLPLSHDNQVQDYLSDLVYKFQVLYPNICQYMYSVYQWPLSCKLLLLNILLNSPYKGVKHGNVWSQPSLLRSGCFSFRIQSVLFQIRVLVNKSCVV